MQSDVERLVSAYVSGFRETMRIEADEVTDGARLAALVSTLEGPPRHLLEMLLISVGSGEAVPERFRPQIEAWGEALWQCGVLLPAVRPSPGAKIDPRHYAGACRTNGALASFRTVQHLRQPTDNTPHPAASDASWDAIIVAAILEDEAPALTKEGVIRKDVERRIITGLGGDPTRWQLALTMARATGLARPAGNRLFGFPESNPRPLTDAVQLLPDESAGAGAALMRIAGQAWISLNGLVGYLAEHCPQVLIADSTVPFADREGQWFQQAADVLHRAGVIDATRGPEGVEAFRLKTPPPPRAHGFMITPDRDVILAPWELPGPEYGRLCRLAPYQDGDVVCRHHLVQEGLAADIASGHEQAGEWLEGYSRTGLPDNIRQNLQQWAEQAVRITIFTGVTVLETEDGFEVNPSTIPSEARMLYYDEPPPARFRVCEGHVEVPFGQDALTVRTVASRVGPRVATAEQAHCWAIAPNHVNDADGLLDELRRYHEGPIPGELEAAIHAGAGRAQCKVEEAVVVHLPIEAAAALQRDRIAGDLLKRHLGQGQCVVDRDQLSVLQARLEALGFVVGGL